jgi:hypothetical protein
MRNTDDFVDGPLTPADEQIMDEIFSENDPIVVKQLLEGVLNAGQWAREVNPEAYEVHQTEENNVEQSQLLRELGCGRKEWDAMWDRLNNAYGKLA